MKWSSLKGLEAVNADVAISMNKNIIVIDELIDVSHSKDGIKKKSTNTLLYQKLTR